MDSVGSQTGSAKRRGPKLACLGGAILIAIGSGCAPTVPEADLKDKFFSQFVDTKLTRSEGHTTFKSDGTFVGEAFGGNLLGQWEWKNGKFCRAGSFDGEPFPYACEDVKISGKTVTLSGPDGTFSYTRP